MQAQPVSDSAEIDLRPGGEEILTSAFVASDRASAMTGAIANLSSGSLVD